jgi:cyclophilin family peptidyl-prolyl cis-trans isomerase
MKKISLFVLFLISFSFLTLAQTKKPVKPAPAKKPAVKHQTVNYPKPPVIKEPRVEITTKYGVMVFRLYNETPLHRDNFLKLIGKGFYDSLLFHRIIKSFMIQGGDPNSKYADSNAVLGSGDVGYKIPAEINPKLFHGKGALAAARDNNPEKMSSGCQFYIVQGKKFSVTELEQVINSRNMSKKQEILYSMYQSDSVQAVVSALQNLGDQERIRTYMEQLAVIADQNYKEKYPNAENVNMDQMDIYMNYGGAPHLDGSYTVFGEIESGHDVLDKIANAPTRPGDRPIEDIRMKIRLLK